ncbi:hypothetical protein [Staphylococcus sp. HMSC14C01]|uniref:hypothetical protein n=1 Tax=Staphylococcus sp. HMSC14C01 TaxID=1581099 RepID=UPI0008A619D5|nr:hypothetical protein [Staphylococcus sp. HMSC14C01]OFV21561.1 hypothetical protein HMPREF3131_08665 [Staphylococcus sp. HMSC14C01]
MDILASSILTAIIVIVAIIITNKEKHTGYSETYHTMYIDHQHKIIQLTIKGEIDQDKKRTIEQDLQAYIDDGYKVLVLDDTFTLRIETNE